MIRRASIDEDRAKCFRETAGVLVADFLHPPAAEKLHRFLTREMPADWWYASIRPGLTSGRHEDLRALPANRAAIAAGRERATQAFQRGEFAHYFFRTKRHRDGCTCAVCVAIATLGARSTLDLLSELTGRSLVRASSFFASCYRSGDFLSRHTDGANGQIGIVLQLTMGWRPEFGGLLQFLDVRGHDVTNVITPRFNSAYVFDIPSQAAVPHFVSHVAADVPLPRLAISGWYD